MGADAPALTVAVAKHLGGGTTATPPLSQTDKVPSIGTTSEKTEDLEQRLRGLMNQSTVVLFMKGSPEVPRCGFSRKICDLLRDNDVKFSHFDILTDESVRQGEPRRFSLSVIEELILSAGLKTLNDWPTYPQLIVKGELVGGLDIVKEMAESGELRELIT